MSSPSLEDRESNKNVPSLKNQADFNLPASGKEKEFTGNGAVANPTVMEASSLRTEKEPSPSQSFASDKVDGDDLEDLNVEQLQVLLFEAEAKARITALRQNQSAPTSLSTGSAQLLQQRNAVSGALPVEQTGLAMSRLSVAEENPRPPLM